MNVVTYQKSVLFRLSIFADVTIMYSSENFD